LGDEGSAVSRSRRWSAVLAIAAAGALASVAVAGDGGERRPRPLDVWAAGEVVRATQGSYCWAGRRRAMCADAFYPLRVRGRLDVQPGQRLRIRTHDRLVRRLEADLVEADGDDYRFGPPLEGVRRVPDNPRAWFARIPADASGWNRISVFVRYRDGRGDSNWWAGIRLGG
jgi:hypothetical protein